MVKKIFAYSYVYLIMLLLYAPIFVLIVFSFTAGTNLGDFSQGFSFDLYAELFKDTELLNALGNTLILAFLSAIISTVLGTCGAIGAYYSKRRSRSVLENLNQIPVVNAEIVMALSLTVMFVFIGSVIFKESIFSFFTLFKSYYRFNVRQYFFACSCKKIFPTKIYNVRDDIIAKSFSNHWWNLRSVAINTLPSAKNQVGIYFL